MHREVIVVFHFTTVSAQRVLAKQMREMFHNLLSIVAIQRIFSPLLPAVTVCSNALCVTMRSFALQLHYILHLWQFRIPLR